MSETVKFEIVQDICIACGNCREVCPLDAIIHSWTPDTKYRTTLIVLQDPCVGCGGPETAPCVKFCPVPGCVIPVYPDRESAALLEQKGDVDVA